MLRKSPLRTPALLAANRCNALRSTGPRTVRGRARVALNALKHGRYARHLGWRLLRADDADRAAVYRDIRSAIFRFRVPCGPLQYRDCERMAAEVWCQLCRIPKRGGTKPECPLDSMGNALRMGDAVCNSAAVPPRDSARPPRAYGRVDIRSWRQGCGVTFWVQRCRFWTEQRLLALLLGDDDSPNDSTRDLLAGMQLEDAVRCRIYRLVRPTVDERLRFGLDRHGNVYPALLGCFLRKLHRSGN